MPGGIFEGVHAAAQEERMRRLDSIREAGMQANAAHRQAVEALMMNKLAETVHQHGEVNDINRGKLDLAGELGRGKQDVAEGKLGLATELGQGGLEVKKGGLDLGNRKAAEVERSHKFAEAHPKASQKPDAKNAEKIRQLETLQETAQQLYDEMPKYKKMYTPNARQKLSVQESLSGVPLIGSAFVPGASLGAPKGWEQHQSGLQNLLVERMNTMGGARAVSTEGARRAFERFHPDIGKGYEYNRERLGELLHYTNVELGIRKGTPGGAYGAPSPPPFNAPKAPSPQGRGKLAAPRIFSKDEAAF